MRQAAAPPLAARKLSFTSFELSVLNSKPTKIKDNIGKPKKERNKKHLF
jgi:hypothetical protein